MDRRFDFPLGLNRHIPVITGSADRDVFDRSQNLPTVAVAHPADFRQGDPGVRLVELAALWIAKRVFLPLLFEAGKPLRVGFVKGVHQRPVEVFQGLL